MRNHITEQIRKVLPPNGIGLKELLYFLGILEYWTDSNNAVYQGAMFRAVALPGLFSFHRGASVWQGRSSLCAVSRQRQVVILVHCAAAETAGLAYQWGNTII